uniref:Movement protein n=1 Tax=Perth betaflexivirus 1 TaxID=2201306 RepID=A0A2U8JQD7_9VIRU|nr:movement protein [Perth betaflexivirus 1]
MAVSDVINVQKVMGRLDSGDTLTELLSPDKLYSNGGLQAIKREVRIKLVGNVSGDSIIKQVPIFDEDLIKSLRNGVQKFDYLHIAAFPISIQCLLISGREDVKGTVTVVDVSRANFRTAAVGAFDFNFSRKSHAEYLMVPNSIISLSCENSIRSIQMMIHVEGIDLVMERECLAVNFGVICMPCSSALQMRKIGSSQIYGSICCTETNNEAASKVKGLLLDAFEGREIELKSTMDTEYVGSEPRWWRKFTKGYNGRLMRKTYLGDSKGEIHKIKLNDDVVSNVDPSEISSSSRNSSVEGDFIKMAGPFRRTTSERFY